MDGGGARNGEGPAQPPDGPATLALVNGRIWTGDPARPEAEAFVRQAGLHALFPIVITRQDVIRMKPHPEPVLRPRPRKSELAVLAKRSPKRYSHLQTNDSRC